jgi:hypothetical protein
MLTALVAKSRYIAANPIIDEDWVVLTNGFVVLLQLAAEPASLAANNRVSIGMIGRLAIVYLCADQVLLQRVRIACQCRFDCEAKKPAEPARSDEHWAL